MFMNLWIFVNKLLMNKIHELLMNIINELLVNKINELLVNNIHGLLVNKIHEIKYLGPFVLHCTAMNYSWTYGSWMMNVHELCSWVVHA